MTLKKVLPFILITVVILGIFFGPFTSRGANAAKFKWYLPMFGFVDPTTIVPAATAQKIVVELIFYLIWTPSKFIFSLASGAFNASIDFTIVSSAFSDLTKGPVATGWGLSRDIVNLFLIFILLYIAIATILQLSGYGAKQLLITLIVIAFLVNFSLVITKLIIDASNILAMEFSNTLTASGSLSATFSNAFDAAKIVDVKDAIQKNEPSLYVAVIISLLFGSAILLITAFIFLVFSILFLIRMVVLLILMIFAPLAFAAMVLPSTKKHASDWWHQLFSQSFFAPAALFMLYLGAVIINSNIIKTILGVSGDKGVLDMLVDASGENPNWENIIKFSLNFVIIAIILIASIIVAKKLGAVGADATQKGLKRAGKKAQGYAGRISRKYGTMAVGRASEGLLKTGAGRLPVVGRGLAKLSGMEGERRKKQVAGYEKGYSNYSPAGLNALKNDPTIFGARREALNNVMAKIQAKKMKEEEKGTHKKELDTAIKSGNIMEIMATSAKMQIAAAEATEEAAGKLSAAAEKETKPPPSKPA